MPDTRVKVALSEETLTEIDARRGDVPRQRYLRRIVEERVAMDRGGHLLDSEDRSAAGDGGWSTKVVMVPEPKPSKTLPKKEQPVSLDTVNVREERVGPETCEHPKSKREVHGWGTVCGICKTRIS